MEIVSLTGTQNIAGGENQFTMLVVVNGEQYPIPIAFETYQFLQELAEMSRVALPQATISQQGTQEQVVFSPPAPPAEPEPPQELNALEGLSKVGFFEPQDVMEAMAGPPPPDMSDATDELMGVLEDTDEEDEEDDPGELIEQYTGE